VYKLKRGQAATEVIFIIALVLIVTIPFLAGSMNNLNKKVSVENKVQKATEIANSFETLSNLGPGNSITVITSDGFQVIDNELYYGDPLDGEQIVMQIIPKVNNIEVDEGEIKIINDADEGITVGESPIIVSVWPGTISSTTLVTLDGDNFRPDSEVYFDNRNTNNLIYINESRIKSSMDPTGMWPGTYSIRVENYIGDDLFISNNIDIFVGGSPSL